MTNQAHKPPTNLLMISQACKLDFYAFLNDCSDNFIPPSLRCFDPAVSSKYYCQKEPNITRTMPTNRIQNLKKQGE